MEIGNLKKYSLLVFDWDGTLVDSEGLVTTTIQNTARDLGYEEPSEEILHKYFGMDLDKFYQILFPKHKKNFPEFLRRFYLNFTEEKLAGNFFDGAIETLEYLKNCGFTLAVATNKSEKRLEAALNLSQTKNLFSTTRSQGNHPPKPNPSMLLDLLEELEYDTQDALMIGDSTFDMEFAKNAQVDVLAACYNESKKQLLSNFNPIGFIEDITELKNIFKNIN